MQMQDCFTNLTQCDLEKAYQILNKIESDKWNNSRYQKPKLRYYNMFKSDLSQEEYTSFNIPKYKRSIFAQFRAGILPLQVEVGRYRNSPLEDRKCTLCDLDAVEDEFHLLCICPLYQCNRQRLFDSATQMDNSFALLDNLDKFVMLISNMQKQVIIFLDAALNTRRSHLYAS